MSRAPRAAGCEAAARRIVLDLGHHARDHRQPAGTRGEARQGMEQALGVGVARRREDPGHRSGLDDATGIHDRNVVRRLRHHAEVMRDEDHGRAHLAAQPADQVQDLRLDGHVERRGRLVGDQELRFAGERHGDHHALAHAAGELVRIAPRPGRRFGDADQAQQLGRPRARGRHRDPFMDVQRLGDLPAHRLDGIERAHRVLEDHRDPAARAAPPCPRETGA